MGLENLCKPGLFPAFAILTLMQTSPYINPLLRIIAWG